MGDGGVCKMQCEIISVRGTFVNSGDLLKIDQQNHMNKRAMPRWVATPGCHAKFAKKILVFG